MPLTQPQVDRYYGREPTDIDIHLNSLQKSLIERNRKESISKTRRVESKITVYLDSKDIPTGFVKDCLKSIRILVHKRPREWEVAESFVKDIREHFEEDLGISLSGGMK